MRPTVEANVVQIVGPRQVQIESEMLILEGIGLREVAAETLYTAISPGTELAAYEGLQPLRLDRKFTKVVGYCNLARVIAVGDGVTRFRVDDLILTLESHRSHFICEDAEILLRLPYREYDDQQLVDATTTYLFHQGYSALLRGDLKPGQYVAVVGLGTLGLATVAVASRFGARVFAFSDLPSAAVALDVGARILFGKSYDDETKRRIAASTAKTGIDMVVLTSSSWDDLRLAVELVRPGGRICLLGFPGRRQPTPPFNPLDPQWFYRKQLSLISCGYTPDVEIDPRDIRFTIRRNAAYLLELVLDGSLPARQLVSTVVPWHRIDDIYQRIASREEGLRTAVLKWAGEEAVDE